MRKIWLFILLCTCACSAFAQTQRRTLPAVKTTAHIVIDGNITDTAWKSASLATDFIEWRPTFGQKEEPKNKTEVWLLYDNSAIYVAGFCHEQSNDSIATELVGRDVVGINDFIGVMFDTYHDEINGFGYYITPLGEQFDAKYSSGGEDGSWNSVFYSAAKIVEGGWTFEMRIPYSAIRFGNKPEQVWGMNITRKRSKSGKQYMWNPVNPVVNGLFIQAGDLTGIRDIKVPVRLSLSPYLSYYANHYPYNQPGQKNFSSSVNGGMDVKYGINQSFTLDMTLIPDFGQVQSDNQVLNLTPFEVKYNEYRTFFTEGTELFSKGNLFYSRRIGGTPIHFYETNSLKPANTKIVKSPSETRLINAVKISGRTSDGLGIGVFNAVTQPTYAIAEGNNNEEYKVETNPLTNYNIVVFDKALKHNSSISFINTNVWRSGHDYDANVSAGLWDLYDKHVNYNFWGKLAVSQLIGYEPNGGNLTGFNYNANFGKMKGRFTTYASQTLADDKYQQNDMGYFTNNNYLDHYFYAGYKWLKPNNWYKNLYYNFNFNYSQRFKPRDYQSVNINTNINGQLKNLSNAGIYSSVTFKQNDFYEPRVSNKVFKRPLTWEGSVWYNSNSAKKYSYSAEVGINRTPDFNTKSGWVSFGNKYRFNDKLTVSNSTFLEFRNRNVGFATVVNDSIVFGYRNLHTVENILNIKYNFNNKMGLSFRVRHYWSKVDYTNFLLLQNDGSVSAVNSISRNPNSNVNFFNIDMLYTWQFAQGSFINISWKDAASSFGSDVQQQYFKNLKNSWQEPQANSLSVRVILYLDYLMLKKKT